MKNILLVILTLWSASAIAGREGNGGAGIFKNGRYVSFYSAGIQVEVEAVPKPIPSLDTLVEFISRNKFIPNYQIDKFSQALLASPTRKYEHVKEETFTPEIRARLLEEYKRITKIAINDLSLFAITETTSNTTFLFPQFEKLSLNDQMAILMHEALWTLIPQANYETIVRAEIAFQRFLEDSSSPEKAFDFLAKVCSLSELFHLSIAWDKKMKILREDDTIVWGGNLLKLTLRELFGENYIKCRLDRPDLAGQVDACRGLLKIYTSGLGKKYTGSAFIRFWNDLALQNKIDVYVRINPVYAEPGTVWPPLEKSKLYDKVIFVADAKYRTDKKSIFGQLFEYNEDGFDEIRTQQQLILSF